MACGCLLLAQPGDRPTRRLAAGLFLVFAAVQASRVVTVSANPCGCFGLLQGAAFMRPFATPQSALLTNLVLAAGLLAVDWAGGRTNLLRNISKQENT